MAKFLLASLNIVTVMNCLFHDSCCEVLITQE